MSRSAAPYPPRRAGGTERDAPRFRAATPKRRQSRSRAPTDRHPAAENRTNPSVTDQKRRLTTRSRYEGEEAVN